MTVTVKPVLFVPFFANGQLVGLPHAATLELCLPVFSTYPKLLQWIGHQEDADSHGSGVLVPSKPLYPYALWHLLDDATEVGFKWIMLDPPADPSAPRQMRDIEDLIEQVEEYM